MTEFNSIEEALLDLKLGKMIIVVDDEDRENEGDFVMAAEAITPEAVNFMATYGRGLICTPLAPKFAENLGLDLMVKSDESQQYYTAFTVSIDHKNCSTGISAFDRALTISSLCSNETRPSDLLRPGHIFPLISKKGGVLKRAGHTEASVDLARLAGFKEVGVICEIMNQDGTMARLPQLLEIANTHNLKLISIKDLIKFRRQNEILVKRTSIIKFPNKHGDFDLHMFETVLSPQEHHVAIVKGEITKNDEVLVRVHSECLTGDIFGSKRCDCGEQLEVSMRMIEEAGKGVLLYMRQEGRGIGLPNKIKAYELQDKGHDTVTANKHLGLPADLRDYGIGAQILKILGVKKMKLMTNNPKKIVGLEGHDLEVTSRVPIEIDANEINYNYLKTKRDKMGHLILNTEAH